jgi:pre-mRNA-splicing factor ATP-dependent RNA helicase DHX16
MLLNSLFLFSLSQREIFDREHKKKLLSLAKEHEKARELENVQRYRMPQDIKDDQMEYEMEVDKAPITEQQKWEEEQMSSAVYKFGAKRQEKEQYELLIDNQIEFIQTANLPGTDEVCSYLLTK